MNVNMATGAGHIFRLNTVVVHNAAQSLAFLESLIDGTEKNLARIERITGDSPTFLAKHIDFTDSF